MKKALILFLFTLCLAGCTIQHETPVSTTTATTSAPIIITPAEDFEYKANSEKVIIKKYIGEDNFVVIPAEIDGVPVTEIDADFLKETSITELIFSDGITKIPGFKTGGMLKKITLPSTLEEYTSNLRNCNKLEEINIGEGGLYKTIDGVLYTEDEKTLLTFPPMKRGKFVIPENVETIDFYAFYSSSLSEISFSENLTEIKDYAFSEAGLTDIIIPSSVKKIGFGAFKESKLEHVTLNDGLENIEGRAFDTESLKELYLPDSVQKCGYDIVNQNTTISAAYPTDGLKFLLEQKTTFRNETTLQRSLRYADDLINSFFYEGFTYGKIYTDLTGDNFPELVIISPKSGSAYIYYFNFEADQWRDSDATWSVSYFGGINVDDEFYVCYDEETDTKLFYSPVSVWNGWGGMSEDEAYQQLLMISHDKIEATVLCGNDTVDPSEMNITDTFSIKAMLNGYEYDTNEQFELICTHFSHESGGKVDENKPLLWRNNEEITSFPYYTSYYPETMKLTINGKDVLRGEEFEGVSYKNGVLTLDNAEIQIDEKDGRAIYYSGMSELTINLIGDSKIEGERLYSVFETEDIPVTIKGEGTLTSTMLGVKFLTISGNAQIFETIEIEKPVTVSYLNITENGVLNSSFIRCGKISVSGNGKAFTRRSEPEYISLSDNGYMEVIMDDNVTNRYSGGRAIDSVMGIIITDNAKLYAENKLCDTIFCYPNNANVTVSGNGILEINSNPDSIGLSLDDSAFGTLSIEENGTVKIYNAGACVYAQRIDIDGGTLDCKAADGGGSVYIYTSKSPYSDFETGFFVNGKIISQSHSNWEMKELLAYAELIAADGEFLNSFSITVKQTDAE